MTSLVQRPILVVLTLIVPNGSVLTTEHQFAATTWKWKLPNDLSTFRMCQCDKGDIGWIVCSQIINVNNTFVISQSYHWLVIICCKSLPVVCALLNVERCQFGESIAHLWRIVGHFRWGPAMEVIIIRLKNTKKW